MKINGAWKIICSIILVLALLSIVCYLIYLIGKGELTSRENSLISIILTVVSILATWLVSHFYSESMCEKSVEEVKKLHQSNLKTYALKAAEKVDNLSNELNNFSLYLQDALDSDQHEDMTKQVLYYQEKLASAIYMINTLKSVNDTSLSDWQGVIGEELDQRREEIREREETLKDIIEKYESIVSSQQRDFLDYQGGKYEVLNQEISDMRKILQKVISGMTQTPIRLAKPSLKPRKQVVDGKCLDCGKLLQYRQRPVEKGHKVTICSNCGCKLISRWNEPAGFCLEKVKTAQEKIKCPWCEKDLEVNLEDLPNANLNNICESCHGKMVVSRALEGVRVIRRGSSPFSESLFTEDVVQAVKSKLPKQPWPAGIHRVVAKELGLSISIVYKAIDELIRRGDFKVQFAGKLFVEENLQGDQKKS